MVESSQTGISLMHGPGAPSAPDLLLCGGVRNTERTDKTSYPLH